MLAAMYLDTGSPNCTKERILNEPERELNPIVRNAICTALHAFLNDENSDVNKIFVDFHVCSIPKYWERPVLIDDYSELWDMYN